MNVRKGPAGGGAYTELHDEAAPATDVERGLPSTGAVATLSDTRRCTIADDAHRSLTLDQMDAVMAHVDEVCARDKWTTTRPGGAGERTVMLTPSKVALRDVDTNLAMPRAKSLGCSLAECLATSDQPPDFCVACAPALALRELIACLRQHEEDHGFNGARYWIPVFAKGPAPSPASALATFRRALDLAEGVVAVTSRQADVFATLAGALCFAAGLVNARKTRSIYALAPARRPGDALAMLTDNTALGLTFDPVPEDRDAAFLLNRGSPARVQVFRELGFRLDLLGPLEQIDLAAMASALPPAERGPLVDDAGGDDGLRVAAATLRAARALVVEGPALLAGDADDRKLRALVDDLGAGQLARVALVGGSSARIDAPPPRATTVARILEELPPSVQRLRLAHVPGAVESFVVDMLRRGLLTDLALEAVPLRPAQLARVGGALAERRDLRSLSLQSTWLADGGLELLVAGLGQQPLLEELNLGNCWIGDGGVRAVASSLGGMRGLRVLDLSANGFGNGAAVLVAKGISAGSELRHAFLSFNRVRDEGARALAGAFEGHPHMRSAHLAGNRIGGPGAKALVDALAHRPGRKVQLDLSGNWVLVPEAIAVPKSVDVEWFFQPRMQLVVWLGAWAAAAAAMLPAWAALRGHLVYSPVLGNGDFVALMFALCACATTTHLGARGSCVSLIIVVWAVVQVAHWSQRHFVGALDVALLADLGTQLAVLAIDAMLRVRAMPGLDDFAARLGRYDGATSVGRAYSVFTTILPHVVLVAVMVALNL